MIKKFDDFVSENALMQKRQTLKDIAEEAIVFYKEKLKIKSKIKLENSTRPGTQGHTTFSDNGHEYSIWIKFNTTLSAFLRTLAHECVHVKQMESGRLIQKKEGEIEFDGKTYLMGAHADTDTYYDQPFELEAWNQERSLETAFRQKYNLTTLFL